ncbi:uncharacterized protein Dwil_GK27555 [Drosophila willistoni]|uniref:Uncharacterized protein n=1 Tax=Drosophila willistoni TaxID=7260 RepID=A0A0Q9X299_DROWI|nr:uncharacterized protein Dwil_GK27555 [Drosophila willistoni]
MSPPANDREVEPGMDLKAMDSDKDKAMDTNARHSFPKRSLTLPRILVPQTNSAGSSQSSSGSSGGRGGF